MTQDLNANFNNRLLLAAVEAHFHISVCVPIVRKFNRSFGIGIVMQGPENMVPHRGKKSGPLDDKCVLENLMQGISNRVELLPFKESLSYDLLGQTVNSNCIVLFEGYEGQRCQR